MRVKQLIKSIVQFNVDKIPFYLSVPERDITLFQDEIDWAYLKEVGIFYLITDESIVLANPKSILERYYSMSGYVSQQVIKAEAWRFIDCNNYLCLDSEAVFLKPFNTHHFMVNETDPFTILHLNEELLNLSKTLGKNHVIDHFYKDNQLLREEFGRNIPQQNEWDFGPAPLIWSKKVWESLDRLHFNPTNQTIWDAIERLPFEIRWYGEALLKFKAIPIYPIEPIFLVFHYDWQYRNYLKNPIINPHHIGELKQSNWEHSLNLIFLRKSFLSRNWRRIKLIFKDFFKQ